MKTIGSVLALLVLAVGAVVAQDTTSTPAQDARPVVAQDTSQAWYKRAWQPLYSRHGLEATYLFYGKANNTTNGVVLKLRNTNPYEIAYSFRLIFRADSLEKEEEVKGRLKAGEAITGSTSGLFWLPFEEGTWISQLGLRDIIVKPVEVQPASPEK